jgi:porin
MIGWSGAKTHFTEFQIHDSGHNGVDISGSIADPSNIDALPTTRLYTAWFEQSFADQHYGVDGAGNVVSPGDPMAVGWLNHRGNGGIYAVADQMLWHSDKTSLNLFACGGLAPSDRNLISYYADGGAGFKGLLPGRADDVLTFGVAYAKISRDAAALDRDTLGIAPPYPIRDEKVVLEMTYAAQIAPWWIVQPDLQCIVHPGGNVPNPNGPTIAIGNAFTAGIRSTIRF